MSDMRATAARKAAACAGGITLAGLTIAGIVVGAPALSAQGPVVRSPGERERVVAIDARRVELGITVADLRPDELGSQVAGGVRVERVRPESPAAAAGFETGDIIVSFDGERVRSARQFARLVEETPAGRTVRAEIVRGGEPRTLLVAPAPRRTADLEDALVRLPDRLRELEPRLRALEPRLREQLRELEPSIRERLERIEQMLRELLEKRAR